MKVEVDPSGPNLVRYEPSIGYRVIREVASMAKRKSHPPQPEVLVAMIEGSSGPTTSRKKDETMPASTTRLSLMSSAGLKT